jgi:hypothetical protein
MQFIASRQREQANAAQSKDLPQNEARWQILWQIHRGQFSPFIVWTALVSRPRATRRKARPRVGPARHHRSFLDTARAFDYQLRMNQPAKLVFIYVQFQVSVNTELRAGSMDARILQGWADFSQGIDSLLNQNKEHCHKIGVGAYVAEEAPCYPAILELIQMCAKDNLPLVIVPFDECVTFSPACQGLQEWLSQKGNSFRLTGFQKPEPKRAP